MTLSCKSYMVIIVLLSISVALSVFGSDREADKERRVAISTQARSTAAVKPLHPDVLDKLALQAVIEARLAAGEQTVPAPPENRQINPGDNCSDPIIVDLFASGGFWADTGQTTCGRGNDYDSTCLDFYDGGEDIMYEVIVTFPGYYGIVLDPTGTSWTGLLLTDQCPPGADCIVVSTNTGPGAHGPSCVFLEPGTYYLMIDTWPAPDCIPEFDLEVFEMFCDDFFNDFCIEAAPIEEVVDFPFSTSMATFDGSGECMQSPNIWFLYAPADFGTALISLCGSEYDTRLAVYEGTCENLQMLACNDDACGLQSEVTVPVQPGDTLLIEVGGYGLATGDGLLTISPFWIDQFACNPDDVVEGEVCGDTVNDGCNVAPPAFGTINCGDTICGEFWAADGWRDTDWYLLTLDQPQYVTLSGRTTLPAVVGFVETDPPGVADCGNSTGYLNPYTTCEALIPFELTTQLFPGQYWVFVATSIYEGFPCSEAHWEYEITAGCEPMGDCDVGGGCDEYIAHVAVGDIDNESFCEGYSDFTFLSTGMEIGAGYPISIISGNGYASDDCAMWVDWNQNYWWDDGERLPLDVETGYGPFTGTITPPQDAVLGPTRLRIRLSYFGDPEGMSPCGITPYGEVEDYTIVVLESSDTTYLQDPNPFFLLARYSVEPAPAALYFEQQALAVALDDSLVIDSLAVNECLVLVDSIAFLPDGWGGLDGDVLKVGFMLDDFLTCAEAGSLIWGLQEQSFALHFHNGEEYGQFNGTTVIRGHISGDTNLDGQVNVADLALLVSYLFTGGPPPVVPATADTDGSCGEINIADLSYLVSYLFQNGPAPIPCR